MKSKFEQYLTEISKEKEWDEPDKREDNSWTVAKVNADGKGFKSIKKFGYKEKALAQKYCDACNRNNKTANFKVIETA